MNETVLHLKNLALSHSLEFYRNVQADDETVVRTAKLFESYLLGESVEQVGRSWEDLPRF
jgi:hypothetical protein